MTESLLSPASSSVQALASEAPFNAHALVLPSVCAMLEQLPALLQTDSASAHEQAAQLLHQAADALQLLEMPGVARLLGAIASVVQLPDTHSAITEHASTPLDILLLAGKDTHRHLTALRHGRATPVSRLFAAYRAVCKLHGKDTAHPADLWEQPWQLQALQHPLPAAAQAPTCDFGPATRAQLDQHVLAVVKNADALAAAQLRQLCWGLSQTRRQQMDAAFWQAAAACFEATAHGLLEPDLYTKRLASRVLMHYASSAKQPDQPSSPPSSLVRDLLYYCAQAAETSHLALMPLPPLLLGMCTSCQVLPADLLHALQRNADAAARPPHAADANHTGADMGATTDHADTPSTPLPASQPAAAHAQPAAHAAVPGMFTVSDDTASQAATTPLHGPHSLVGAPGEIQTDAPASAPDGVALATLAIADTVGTADTAPAAPLAVTAADTPSPAAVDTAPPNDAAAHAPADADADLLWRASAHEAPLLDVGLHTAAGDAAHVELAHEDAAWDAPHAFGIDALDFGDAQPLPAPTNDAYDALDREGAAPSPAHEAQPPQADARLDVEQAANPSMCDTRASALDETPHQATCSSLPTTDAPPAYLATDALDPHPLPEMDAAAEAVAAPEIDAAAAAHDGAQPEPSTPGDAVPGDSNTMDESTNTAITPTQAPTLPNVPPALAPALLGSDYPVLTDLVAPAVELQPSAPLLQGTAAQPVVQPDADFLAEAQALTTELQQCITAWVKTAATAPCAPPAAAATYARTLTRSAWSAGCTEISVLSYTLQTVLERLNHHASRVQRHICVQTAQEIHRLLHQFAAGFVRRAQPQIIESLNQILADHHVAPVPAALPEDEAGSAADLSAQATPPTPQAAAAAAHTPAPDTALTPAQPAAKAPAPPAPPQPQPAALDQLEPVRFAVFEEEVLGIWPQLQTALHAWMCEPTTPHVAHTPRAALLRGLHTLKGSARLAGALAWATQVHALEDLALLAQPCEGPLGPESLQQPLEVLRIAFVALQQEMATRHPERNQPHWGASPVETIGRHVQALWSTHEQAQLSLTDSTATLEEVTHCLQRLRSHIYDCAGWADTLVLHGDMDLSYEWHEELHQLVRTLHKCTDDIGTVQQQLHHHAANAETALSTQAGHLRAMQHTLLYARLAPLSLWLERLNATAALAASDTGKAVRLLLEGGEQLMDRHVAEQLVPALDHLLRNCVDHGIEDAATRHALGKPTEGCIRVQLSSQGTTQTLVVQDDGAGLQHERIHAKAVHLGLIDADAPVDAAQAARLILQPGLSTASTVTELSGRGIGMDAVDATVQALGGQLHIDSTTGQGCRFVITLAAPPQIEQVVALRAGSWCIAVPARSIESVRRIPHAQMARAVAQGMLADDISGPMPLYWAGAVWQQSARSNTLPLDGQSLALVVRGETARWALQVDEVLGTQEVALQPANDIAVPLPGLLGTAAQPSGQVLQVYDPYAALAAHEARRLLHSHTTPPEEDTAALRPLVLIADDSLSVRRLAQQLLHAHGYRVETAADGLQALNMLENGELPALLLADIEMPEVDGLELLRRVRADERLRQLPVLMLTAHEAGPVSQKAIDGGAQAFLTKPYSPNELLALVRRCACVPHSTPQPSSAA